MSNFGLERINVLKVIIAGKVIFTKQQT